MNKTTQQLFKQYIIDTLNDPQGVSSQAYRVLISIMQEDRTFAYELHDIIDRVGMREGRYSLTVTEEELEEFDNYEL